MKEAAVICVGLQDPIKVPKNRKDLDLEEGIERLTKGATLADLQAEGYEPGPVATALASAEARKVFWAVEELWLVFSPGSDPSSIDRLAASTRAMVQTHWPRLGPLMVEISVETWDVSPQSEPGSPEVKGQRPLKVADYEECLREVPARLRAEARARSCRLHLILGPGTPQMNAGLLEAASQLPDSLLYQVLNPRPGGFDLNSCPLRRIERPRTGTAEAAEEASGQLRQKIAALEEENRKLASLIQAAAPRTEPGGWTSLSTDQRREKLASLMSRSLTQKQMALELGISDRAVRDAQQRLGLVKKGDGGGRGSQLPPGKGQKKGEVQ